MQSEHTNVCTFDIFWGYFSLLCALRVSASWPFNLENIVQLSTVHFLLIWKDKNCP
jgi:hypothetical protein